MNQKQFEQAKPLINRIENIQKALAHMEKHAPTDWGDDMNDFDSDGVESVYFCYVGIHKDSRDGIDLNGCMVADEIYQATKDILEKKLEKFTKMLDEI